MQFKNLYRFGSAYKLKRNKGFGHVLKAESLVDKNFKVFFIANSGENAKLGIIAEKKIIPCSTDRNSLKRIIRETFRCHKIKLCKFDVVVKVNRLNTNKIDLSDNLSKLFTKVENRCAEL